MYIVTVTLFHKLQREITQFGIYGIRSVRDTKLENNTMKLIILAGITSARYKQRAK